MTDHHRIAAIQTRFAAHLFRSRLEARWAAWFELLDLEWTYEPFDAAGYIPDFLVKPREKRIVFGGFPCLIEVRGVERDDPRLDSYARESSEACVLGGLLAADGLPYDVIVLAANPDFSSPDGILGVYYADPERLAAWWLHYKGEPIDHPVEVTAMPLYARTFIGRVDISEMREAWGAAHEISRWVPRKP